MTWLTTSLHVRGDGKEHEKSASSRSAKWCSANSCSREGRTRAGNIADHIVPLAKGGKTERSNNQLLCKSCSNKKTIEDGGRKCGVKRRIGYDGWPRGGVNMTEGEVRRIVRDEVQEEALRVGGIYDSCRSLPPHNLDQADS